MDTLFVPLNAPWMKLSESIDFVRAVKPGRAFALHDALLTETGAQGLRRPPGAARRHEVRARGARAPRSPDVPSDTDELIRRLYEAPPDGFVAARAAAIADAREAGDKETAKRLAALRSRPWRPGWSTCSRCAAPI